MITLAEDDFTMSRRHHYVRWLAILSDGTTAIDDNGRPGYEKASWLRLRDYLYESGLAIAELKLQYSSNVISPLPHNADGYYFSNMVIGSPGISHEFVVIGVVEGETLTKSMFTKPALTFLGCEVSFGEKSAKQRIIYGLGEKRTRCGLSD